MKFKKEKRGEVLLKMRKGFTMVELLIVIGIIAIIAALAFVALNPLARFQDARNAERWSDVNAIISAIKLYQLDNNGVDLNEIANVSDDLYYQIGNGDSCDDDCLNPTVVLQAECLDLEELVDSGKLAELPMDPSDPDATEEATKYYFLRQSNGAVTVGSCSEEMGSKTEIPDISVRK